jgi:hypothetical protein
MIEMEGQYALRFFLCRSDFSSASPDAQFDVDTEQTQGLRKICCKREQGVADDGTSGRGHGQRTLPHLLGF